MAGGKETPRQKMIGMMYLVFIAMLAMNMSKEVLSAFGFMNEELVESNISTTSKNMIAYEGLATKAQDQAKKFAPLLKNANVVKQASTELYDYLEALKADMTKDLEDKKAYESMDKTAYLDENFFKGDGFTAKGKAFVDKIESYRKAVIAEIGSQFPSIKKDVDKRFSTSDAINKDGKKIKWLEYRYKGFPLVASLTNLTQLQANIRKTENDVLTALLGGQLEADSKLTGNNYKGIVSLNKTAYFAGEKVVGQVVLGRYDANLVPTKVTLNGRNITKNVKNGQIILDMPAGNVGNKDIKGEITFMQDGEPAVIPFESKYSVIAEPSTAVVSADKMNVVYRGLDNPISVSLPGVAAGNLNISATGGILRGQGASRSLRPGKSNIVTINVSAKLSSGKTVSSKKEFRVKDIPAAMASTREKYGIIKLPKSSVGRLKIGAGLPDFVFDLKLNVTGFKLKVPGQITVLVKGNTFNAQAKKAIASARKGDVITVFGVQATISGNSSYKLKEVLPLSIEVIN